MPYFTRRCCVLCSLLTLEGVFCYNPKAFERLFELKIDMQIKIIPFGATLCAGE
jgi:hypothetical protein